MKINRQNYELFAIDFIEGKMNPSEAAVFIAFLSDNPDIGQEVELMRDFDTEPVTPNIHQDFSFLKKDYNQIKINSDNFEELCIASHEGDLNEHAKKKLVSFIGFDKKKQQIFNTYKQLKIAPDETIVFKTKSTLKHKTTIGFNARRIALISTMAAAASLAMVFIFRNYSNETDIQKIAQTNATAVQKTPEIKTEANILEIPVTRQIKENDIPQTIQPVIKQDKEETDESKYAAVSDSSESEVVRLTRIEPKSIQNKNHPEVLAFAMQKSKIIESNVLNDQNTIEEIRDKTNVLVTKASQLSVDNIIKTGINGLNSIAETDLNYKSQTDEKGRIIEFALSSETFNIKRKIRAN